MEHRGAHRDLCVARLHASALALEDAFAAIARTAQCAAPSIELREELGAIGRRGERTMLRASGGTNTHRGALWALGLLVAGGASVGPAEREPSAIVARAAALAALPDRFARRDSSHGAIVARRYGTGGAMAEARAGFPNVMKVALPLLRRSVAPADVMLALLAVVDDTCVLHRGGPAGARFAQTGARVALRSGGTSTRAGLAKVRVLDAAFVAHNISPGGCADLLAAGLFLAAAAR
jgi:triphosphoribosyl-dephospho-CoA synthase